MLARLTRMILCLAVLLPVYVAYRLLVVPWIEPSLHARSSEAVAGDAPRASQRHDELADLFPEGAWERKNPKLLKTEQGMLLFEDYRPLDETRLELRPCTLVFYTEKRQGESQGRPVVLRAPQRAVLEFAGGVNLLKARLGKLRGGRLEGEITIYTPPALSPPGQELRLVTRNVQIEPQRIWTPHELEFHFGPHFGKGRALTIQLGDHDNPVPIAGRQPKLNSIRSLELSRIDRISLLLAGGGPLAADPAAGASPRESAEDKQAAVPVELTCDGPFRFDFQTNVASFEERVDVVRLNADGPSDTLRCHRLALHLRGLDNSSKKLLDSATGSNPPAKETRPTLDRIVASGHPVQLNLASYEADVRAELLEYRFATRSLHLRDSQAVRLSHQHHTVSAPELEYALADSPARLGRLWAAGPGRIVSRPPDDRQEPLEARWSGELRLVPEGDEHVLSLESGAEARMKGMGEFSAERIFIWLRERPEAARDAAADSGREGGDVPETPEVAEVAEVELADAAEQDGAVDSGPAEDAAAPEKREPAERPASRGAAVVPSRMLAEGNVRFDSPQLTGSTGRLEIWFREKRESEEAEARGERPASPNRSPGRDIIKPPAGGETKNESRLRLQGNLIRLEVLHGANWHVRHVTVAGQVQLAQLVADPRTPPLTVQGDVLELDHDAAGHARLDMTGRPARVTAQGATIVGANLHLHQRSNRVWIDGPGSMTLPPPQAAPQSALLVSVPLTIHWQGGMQFDGHTAAFREQVEVQGRQKSQDGSWNDATVTAAALEVELVDMLDFRAPQAAKADIKQLRFLADQQGVALINRGRDARGAPQSMDRMQLKRLTVEGSSGNLRAEGPGWVSTVRYSKNGFPDGGGTAAGNTAAPDDSSAAPPRQPTLIYLFVAFEEAIAGNIYNREFHFLDDVRVIHGPVRSWDEQLRGRALQQLPAGSVTLRCDRLAIADMGRGGSAQLELLAVGNTQVEGVTRQGQFAAEAHRLSYVQSKDLLVMEGDGRRDATWQGQRAGRSGVSRAAARKIMYSPRDGRVEVDSFQYLNLGQ